MAKRKIVWTQKANEERKEILAYWSTLVPIFLREVVRRSNALSTDYKITNLYKKKRTGVDGSRLGIDLLVGVRFEVVLRLL
jgi:hypothetical protein